MLKVGVWGPGSMGIIALRGVIDHPELQLTNLVVHSDAKGGRDAGELCGIAPVGVVATQDPASMLAGDADVVVYAAGANLRPVAAIEDMVSILRAGKNVVSCSVVPLVFPDAVDGAFTDPLRQAALDGAASFFTTGIDSGFANDVLPLVLTGVSRAIESVRMTEMFNYATYPDRAAVYEILGFGKPPEYPAFAAQPGVFTFGWGPVLHQLAAGLGVKIDNIEESNERIAATESFDTPTGHIAAGTIAAMRSTLTGYVAEKPTFVVDHVTRMRDDIAGEWPQPHIGIAPKDLGYGPASGRGVYRVEIEGSPSMRCEFEMAEDHDHDLGARIAGSSRMVNAIPAVCAAAPGLLSALDLPLVTGAGLVRAVDGPSPDSRLF
ncbi:NAD(P)H-dependent amine dehydrogenase family protein [Mycobacterium montefiorense]|uniref:Diacylglycerol kinase n=1 Tax=Mycobacterium montefiorense TaxID=154654 RepID=A0AA37PL48_9MYCO|nr:dihydrodipicolinate reductase [Mycobacterium montefiorense]GBG37981.1 diacylglycerol kinase [Mycobacterium montefiorense]GKU33870.1 diacylglycerol kinase [Mycobacterium montefiorense]GKU41351.1 diacylglycerol kinase [Mycobacterium montefiorense]GKU46261.1 diacylglycerol kinase [Mycobacterium montefiorense]GKU52418.1 diacylglycerol kinase [Mycobacterium montefiorense]